MKTFKILPELPDFCDTETRKWANAVGKMARTDLLNAGLPHKPSICEKNAVSVKLNKAKCNKARYACETQQRRAGWKSRRFNIGFAGGATISQGMWVASRSWEWPQSYNQNELNSASMSMSGSRFSPQPLEKSPGWLTPLFWPLEIFNRIPSWARQDFCLKNLGIINGYCFKLLNLWRFVMATTEN